MNEALSGPRPPTVLERLNTLEMTANENRETMGDAFSEVRQRLAQIETVLGLSNPVLPTVAGNARPIG